MSNKEKTEALQKLKEDSLRILSMPEVSRRLGDYTVHLKGAVERTAIVHADEDGFLDISTDNANAIPLVALHLGEVAYLHAEDSGMSEKQVTAVADTLGSEKAFMAARKLKKHFTDSKVHAKLPVLEEDSGLAVTSANYWLPNEDTLVQGRPYVAMNMEKRVNGHLSPIVFLHELIHVLQKEQQPITPTNKFNRAKVRSELEAFHVAAQIIFGFKDAGRQLELLEHSSKDEMDRARQIESVRSQRQGSHDPFEPTDAVVKGLVDDELAITSEVRQIIRKNKST